LTDAFSHIVEQYGIAWGILSILSCLFIYVVYKKSKDLIEQAEHQISDFKHMIMDREHNRVISLKELVTQLEEILERLEITQNTVHEWSTHRCAIRNGVEINKFVDEARQARQETSKKIELIQQEIQGYTDELFALIRLLLDRDRNGVSKSVQKSHKTGD
jgi:hypothetical protein